MRLAVLSDIHGNLTALEAVIADLRDMSPDLVIHGGDLVGSGARPGEVVDRIRELGWSGVHGNSDEMVWNEARVAEMFSAPSLRRWRAVVERAATATRAVLGDARTEWLRALPLRRDEKDVTVVHASPNDCWRSPLATSTDEELMRTYGALESQVVVYGHIHHAYVRILPSIGIINAGSVSLSYDGDPRAAYAVIDGTRITIRRVEYDIEREARALFDSGCPDAEWIGQMLRTAAALPPPET